MCLCVYEKIFFILLKKKKKRTNNLWNIIRRNKKNSSKYYNILNAQKIFHCDFEIGISNDVKNVFLI